MNVKLNVELTVVIYYDLNVIITINFTVVTLYVKTGIFPMKIFLCCAPNTEILLSLNARWNKYRNKQFEQILIVLFDF